MVKKVLAILPVSIGGRLTTNSIINGFRQNDCDVVVYDELFGENFEKLLKQNFDLIVGYDFSGLKIKIDNNLNIKSCNYFSDEIRSKTSGPEWQKYLPYLKNDDNYTFYWDEHLAQQENFKNLFYMPHFVDFEIYKDLKIPPTYDVMFAGRLDTDFRLNFFENLMDKLPDVQFAWYAIERHFGDAKKRSKQPQRLEKIYQGFIDNEEDMARAINDSKIVFNMNSQGVSSLNYRTFQTVACKRILISDQRKELKLFAGNMPFYDNVDDLAEKIKYFLANPLKYNEVTETCYHLAKQNHNSKDCVAKILKCMV